MNEEHCFIYLVHLSESDFPAVLYLKIKIKIKKKLQIASSKFQLDPKIRKNYLITFSGWTIRVL